MYKVLICGDRNWGSAEAIERDLKKLIAEHGANNLLVIAGGAPGADTLARVIAHQLNVHVAEVMALWNTRFRGAGPQRNSVMLALEPNEVIAYHTNISKSRGTADTVRKANKAGIPTRVVKR